MSKREGIFLVCWSVREEGGALSPIIGRTFRASSVLNSLHEEMGWRLACGSELWSSQSGAENLVAFPQTSGS